MSKTDGRARPPGKGGQNRTGSKPGGHKSAGHAAGGPNRSGAGHQGPGRPGQGRPDQGRGGAGDPKGPENVKRERQPPQRGRPPREGEPAAGRGDKKGPPGKPGKPGDYSTRLIRKAVLSARPKPLPEASRSRGRSEEQAASGDRDRRGEHGAGDAPVERARVRFSALKPSSKTPARPPRTSFPARGTNASGAAATAARQAGAARAPSAPSEPMRIAKAMARAGLCSRRDAERWIADGRVSVNGKLLTTPAIEVGPGDRILVDGAPLPAAAPAQIWRYHKPRGLVTTHADPEGRPTVFDALPPELPRVVSIGRLDFNTEGLLLLTNDGELARHLELPATGWLRRYRVRAFGRVTDTDLASLKDGVTIDGVRYGGIDATIDSVQAGNIWLTIALREGKNREVRRILGSLSLEVNRLIRVSYGPFQLKDLAPGTVEAVKRRVLADQLGPDAERFGLTGAIDGYKARQATAKGHRSATGAADDGEDDDA